MSEDSVKGKKRRIAWGITGSGEKLRETIDTMKTMKEQYDGKVEVRVYLSKAGEQVVKWYRLDSHLRQCFDKVWVEVNSNSPFLAGELQMGRYEFLLIAPASSNSVAKIATGISDTLLCNSAIMALKATVPVYILPSDYEEGTLITTLPNGKGLKLRVRKEDSENTRKLSSMNGVFVLKKPDSIPGVFMKHFGAEKT
jgi:archaeoflavoprotein AfpA